MSIVLLKDIITDITSNIIIDIVNPNPPIGDLRISAEDDERIAADGNERIIAGE